MLIETITIADGAEQSVLYELESSTNVAWSVTVVPTIDGAGTAIIEGKNSNTIDKWFQLEGGSQDFTSDGVAFYDHSFPFEYCRIRLTSLTGTGDIDVDIKMV